MTFDNCRDNTGLVDVALSVGPKVVTKADGGTSMQDNLLVESFFKDVNVKGLVDEVRNNELARMDEEIMSSNLCDQGDVVIIGPTHIRPNVKKWKRIARGGPLQKLIHGCSNPIQRMLLAKHFAKRGQKLTKRSPDQKLSSCSNGEDPNTVIVLDPRGKRKGVEALG
ncbi:hypothetical protein ACOSQ3_007195 [Xanthoceras sorbifolium]